MIRFICVEDDATRRSAARLIREYLDWIQRQAADTCDLAFDIDAMVASDLEDGSSSTPRTGGSTSRCATTWPWAWAASSA
jgi:hypothetical protein